MAPLIPDPNGPHFPPSFGKRPHYHVVTRDGNDRVYRSVYAAGRAVRRAVTRGQTTNAVVNLDPPECRCESGEARVYRMVPVLRWKEPT